MRIRSAAIVVLTGLLAATLAWLLSSVRVDATDNPMSSESPESGYLWLEATVDGEPVGESGGELVVCLSNVVTFTTWHTSCEPWPEIDVTVTGGDPDPAYDSGTAWASVNVVADTVGTAQLQATATADDDTPSLTMEVTVVEVDRIVEEGTSDEGTLYVCLDESVFLEAKPNPSGTAFPSDQPEWTVTSEPSGASATLSPSSGSATTTLDDLTEPGDYVIEAKCCNGPGDSITVTAVTVELPIDHVCTNAVHASHEITVGISPDPLPPGVWVDLELRRVSGSAGAAVFTNSGTATISLTNTTSLTVMGTEVSDEFTNMVLEAELCGTTPVCTSALFTVADVTELTATEVLHGTNTVTDATQGDDTNTVYICQTSNGTATLELNLSWLPTNYPGSGFLWDILLTNETAGATQWSQTNGTFAVNPTNVVWTNSASAGGVTNREFLVRAWFDCDGDNAYNGDEPHRRLYVTVVGLEGFTVTEVRHDTNTVTDTTDADETNMVYICQSTNGTADLELALAWLPGDRDVSEFLWGIETEDSGSASAEWDATSGDFSNNPTNVRWTIPTSGVTNRKFKVTAWYDCDGDDAYDADEPHRLIHVTVVGLKTYTFTVTEDLHDANKVEDTTTTYPPETNRLYICQGTDGTAKVNMELTWEPEKRDACEFLWRIETEDGGAADDEWDVTFGDFKNTPTNATWSVPEEGETNRKFRITAWYDCDKDEYADEDEPVMRVHVTVVGLDEFTVTEDRHAANTATDADDGGEIQKVYVCDGTNGTAKVAMDLDWVPDDWFASEFRWQIKTLAGGSADAEWDAAAGDFHNNPTNVTWTTPGTGPTNREFRITAWYDCASNDTYDADEKEPHRKIDVTVVGLHKLILTNSECGYSVEDVTSADEEASSNNVLYLCEDSDGLAEMDIELQWLPETVNSNWFRWEILLTNETAGATQWSQTNGTFAINPTNVVWTNSASAGGVTNREFFVRAWYDCDGDDTYDSDEPHRLLYATVVKMEILDPGEVAFTGATVNISFSLTPDSWTNCTWQIDPYIVSGGALFAPGSSAPGSNWYWTGTSVWINPGTVATNYTITVRPNAPVACEDVAGLVVCRDMSWTPAGSNIYVWEPVNDGNFSSGFVDDLASNYQGWDYSTNSPITWFRDPSTTDNDCGDCTLANLKAMKNGGVVVMLTHGNTGVVEVARFLSKTNAEAWMGSDTNYFFVSPGPSPATNWWSVLALPPWFQTNWKPDLDLRKAIVFLEVCHSADGAVSIASSVGGKAAFGVSGSQLGVPIDVYYQAIVEYMNGTALAGAPWKRPAKIALTQPPGVSSYIKLEGDGRSTLCPVPQTVFPASATEAKTEWGCIAFDTYMNGLTAAGDAVVPTAGTVGNRSWGSDGTGNAFIEFEFSGTGITMEAVSNKCRSVVSVYPGRPLDGDCEAPMPPDGESKTWSW